MNYVWEQEEQKGGKVTWSAAYSSSSSTAALPCALGEPTKCRGATCSASIIKKNATNCATNRAKKKHATQEAF
eukprot:CAMPEP_0202418644 /NCGR_PEP_ID=MMETSP1128-20130828/46933_1 /ASSEMBLY_ACC=CAM_ASM_000463 /TAXON_ID=3047 /ORGANISM="Dunaliella tertiolecta, Strain CCMP1320" /LENGTH=72 /DNA_ID=CAMNT_0049026355 /DNA_START=114 /DNA_END=333 /DNA_ORIENTATION=-